MPPKKDGASKKTMDKVATKVIEDKTFGLKNKKKSKKVQAYVESVAKQVKSGVAAKAGAARKGVDEMHAEAAKKAKEQQAALEREMAALLRSTIKQPKLEPGVDPKSVLCEFFKQGCCEKGDKCKFSHDLTVGRKAAKIDLYTDRRRLDGDGGGDETNADWDQSKLEEVVKTKHGAEKPAATRTDIVCKFFLDAIEKEVYGWFWKCPNGEDCKYKHALPAGYVYKSKKDRDLEAAARAAEADNAVSMEELIEEERKKLPPPDKLTPVTAESFAAWKEARAKRKAEELEARRVEEAKRTGTKGFSVLSGRALFTYDPALFVDDDAADADVYSEHDEEEEAGGAASASASGAASSAAGAPIDESVFLADGADDLEGLEEEEEEDGDDGAEEEDEDGEAEEDAADDE